MVNFEKMFKRPASPMELAVVADKKVRLSTTKDVALIDSAQKPKRHSLKGQIMLLSGHDAEIYCCRFHPSGTAIASAGVERSIYLWSTRGDCENYAILRAAHSNTILDLGYSVDGERLYSCSADKTVIIWDSATAYRLKKLRNHQSHVNGISASRADVNLLASVSDDCHLNVWDIRTKKCVKSFKENYQLLGVAFSKTNNEIFVGGIENCINTWDMRNDSISYSMRGHRDTVTGLSLSPDGNHLLSNSMDKTLRSWDVKSKATSSNEINRLEKVFMGNQHDHNKNLLRCSWSPKGNILTAGSSDNMVHIWNFNTCEIIFSLPGHKMCVNDVQFSPIEPLVLSCSDDRQMYLGDIGAGL